MKSEHIKKGLIWGLIVCLGISLIVNYNYYQKLQTEETYFNNYLADFYSELNNVQNNLQYILEEEPVDYELQKYMMAVSSHLVIIEHLLESTPSYLSDIDHTQNEFKAINALIRYGDSEEEVDAFLEDGVIDENEDGFLNDVEEQLLQPLINQLESNEGHLRNDISVDKFNQMTKELVHDPFMDDLYYQLLNDWF
ncbi:hypothetical protein [Alkalibacillus aidingensis]|uniref:hypothetical protein n=1 Tax=Alkalibacillus aidingensis TaxID=2747607 RepID=UPI00166065F8|nr:hypothetical protein [Alkalibacillus aidingensis]